jgi:O-antigen/teichoic acid export membrane protein
MIRAPVEVDLHRSERNRRLSRNVAFGLAGRAANALIALATVPLLVGLLGAERYGLYVTVTAAMGWIQLGILGIGKGLVNTLVAAHARGDEADARCSLWSFWAGLAGIVAGTGAALAAVFSLVPWARVFPAPVGVATGEVSRTVAVAAAFTLLALVLSPISYVFTAYQDERKSTLWAVVRNGATLAALGAVWLSARASMPRVALAVGVATLVANLASLAWLLARDKPFLRPRTGDVRADHLRRAMAASLSFFAIDLAAILAYQTDKLLVLQLDGARPVAEFELASVGFLLAQSVFGVVLLPMWPALGEAVRRGDHAWARTALARLVRWSTLGMAAVVAVLVAVGPFAIRLWTGNPDVVPGRWLLLAVGAYYLVRTFTECFTIVLYGLDRQRELFPAVLANGVLVVGLGILLGRPFGVLGVAVSNVLAFALTQAIWVPWRARRHLARLDG